MNTGRAGRRAALLVVAIVISGGWSVVGGAPAGAQACGPAPSGRIAVAVVIDPGTAAPVVRCVIVNEGATGYDALTAAVGVDLRLSPEFADPFVCGLLGTPATGCDTRTQSWAYWHGVGGKWKYSTVGVGGYRLPARCAVEGWRYGTNATPRTDPPAVQCDAPAPATTPAPAPVTSPPSNGGAPSGGAAAGPYPTMPRATAGSAPGIGAPAPAPAPGATSTGPPATVAGQTTIPGPPGTSVPGDGAAPSAGAAVGDGAVTTPAAGDVDDPEASRASDPDGRSPDGELASTSTGGGSDSGPGVGLIAAVTLLVVLGGIAAVRHRMGRPTTDLDPDA